MAGFQIFVWNDRQLNFLCRYIEILDWFLANMLGVFVQKWFIYSEIIKHFDLNNVRLRESKVSLFIKSTFHDQEIF